VKTENPSACVTNCKVCRSATVLYYLQFRDKSVARIRLVKTENPSACVTVNCKVCRAAIAL
jgi:hypothetical protein